MSKFDLIATFIDVVEENGFAAAARKKGISTAAVSRHIAALEKHLGTQLLQRTTRTIVPTETGEHYYQQCKNTLIALGEAELAIAESRHEATGILHVMANRYFAMTHILPRLPEFMQQNPALQLHFQLAEQFPNLEKEGIDIMFGVSVEGSAELIRRRIYTTRYILCASPDYLNQHGTPQTPTDLTRHSYITHSMRNPDNIVFLKDSKIFVNPVLRLNDSYAMRECAENSMGIVNLHDYMVADALHDGSLVEVLRPYQEPKTHVYLYFRQSRYLQPKIRRFIDFYSDEKVQVK